MSEIIRLEEIMELKGGENRHLNAQLLAVVDENGNPIGKELYSKDTDLGAKAREPGWTNAGDISSCLRTKVALSNIYKDSKTPHIVLASKHTRPVVIANGRTQLEAAKKAIAGDLNSPFGGVWGLNTPLEYETAEFLDRMFFEGVIAPEFDRRAAELLKDTSKVKAHKNRFLIETGYLTQSDVNVFEHSLQPIAMGYFLKQEREKPFNVLKECTVITGNNGNSNIASLDEEILADIEFAGNAALYLSSNLVFYVHNGAIAGLGDGCGSRVFAAEKARRMLEVSAYAAISADNDELWEAVLYDTPFTREDFEGIKRPIRLTAFSDAFFPKLDGFVETSGIDRIKEEFGARKVRYKERKEEKIFIPKRDNFDQNYDMGLIPVVVVQPGGSLGDKVINPLAEEYGIKMVFTMTPEKYQKYLEKGPGRGITGRRFFGHIIMS